jgi:glutaminyl-tRNA synthetase
MSAGTAPGNFIRTIVDADAAAGKLPGGIVTRFPPEPNGYLHIGHAKSIVLNFGLAQDYGGRCHLRFDDTNPLTEDPEYVASIQADVRWLGFDWGPHLYHASDYFERLYEFAVRLVRKGKAYVCDLSAEEIRDSRGTLTEPGRESPHRGRPVEENLALLAQMRAGAFPDGSRTLRARIDMAAPNLNLRDPVIYRIRRAPHYRTGDAWCIYPSYDWAHGQSDFIEGVTHSICTLEFEDHRPLYDWFLEQLEAHPRPRQIEFARLNLGYTVMSKRLLQALVREGVVAGWDDPRMPTLAGLRRRGVTPAAIRQFCADIGVARADSQVDIGQLESCIRRDLEPATPRVLCVHDPLRVVVESWPEEQVLELDAPYFPDASGRSESRRVPFSRELYIEREDFLEDPPKDFFRLAPGREVRLRRAYVIRCERVVKDDAGRVVELRCTHDSATLNANPVGRKVKGTVHWVSAAHAVPAEVRLYDRLFTVPNPTGDKDGDYRAHLNPASLEVLPAAMAEPSLAAARPGERFQFERKGFYCVDPVDSREGRPVFNRIVTLRDTWAKEQAKVQGKG